MSDKEKEAMARIFAGSGLEGGKFINSDEYSEDELKSLAKLYSESFRDIKEGEIIQGKIVGITADNVVVDVGFKSDGTISKSEFNSTEEIKIGEQIDIVIESVEDEEGNLVLSKRRADFLKIWARIMDAFETEKIITGKILKRIKGGMVVDLMGIEAFLPGSQIDIRPVRDFDAFVGQTMDFRIVKVNIPTENVVVSHKILIEETITDQKKKFSTNSKKVRFSKERLKPLPTSACSSISAALTVSFTLPISAGAESTTRAKSLNSTRKSKSSLQISIRKEKEFLSALNSCFLIRGKTLPRNTKSAIRLQAA